MHIAGAGLTELEHRGLDQGCVHDDDYPMSNKRQRQDDTPPRWVRLLLMALLVVIVDWLDLYGYGEAFPQDPTVTEAPSA